MDDKFSWSAFNPQQWDGDHHAGVQEIYLRRLPLYTTVHEPEPWWMRIAMSLLESFGWRQ